MNTLPITGPNTSLRVNFGTLDWPGPGGKWFGPGVPMQPGAPSDVDGRRFDYTPGYNFSVQPRTYEPIGFPELRAMADGYDLLRLIIETCKGRLTRLPWQFGLEDPKAKPTPEQQARIDAYTKFFKRPDGRNKWSRWLKMVLEDLYVIDAVSIYKRKTMDGRLLLALDPIDGALINLKIDGNGYTPLPPFPAYEQVLHGTPARDYTTDQLIYFPENIRTHKMYGYGRVEQAVMSINIALRRQVTQLNYFTEGNMPEALIGVPSEWTPDQVRSFQAWFDSVLAGNLAERSKVRFVPGDIAKGYVNIKDGELFGAADEWLVRVFCFAFGISAQPFLKMMNRATAETAQEAAEEDGLGTTMGWIVDLIDTILISEFGETEIGFRWTDRKELDPQVQMTVETGYIGAGVKSRNEVRTGVLGLEQDPSTEANELMITTAMGATPLSVDTQIDAAKKKQDALGPPPGQPGDEPPPAGGAGGAPPKGPAGGSVAATGDGGKTPPKKPAPKTAKARLGGAGGDAARRTGSGLIRAASTARIERTLSKGIAGVFKDVAKDVGAQVRKLGEDFRKADTIEHEWTDAEIDAFTKKLSLDLSAVVDVTEDALETAAEDAATQALAMLGVPVPQDVTDRVYDRAVEFAKDRSAELVGKRWVDGELLDNPNPKWAIDESTRNMLRDTIAKGLEDNIGFPAIADQIESLDAKAFSPERAATIAETEVANANSQGDLIGYREARDSGINVKKSWEAEADCCDDCDANATEGAIDLDDDFPSGDDAPPAHPNCRCAIVPEVVDEDDQ